MLTSSGHGEQLSSGSIERYIWMHIHGYSIPVPCPHRVRASPLTIDRPNRPRWARVALVCTPTCNNDVCMHAWAQDPSRGPHVRTCIYAGGSHAWTASSMHRRQLNGEENCNERSDDTLRVYSKIQKKNSRFFVTSNLLAHA